MNLINAPEAPDAIGPYSHAVELKGLIFCSGQIPLDPGTMKLVKGGIEEQTHQVFSNIRAVLHEAGSGLNHVMKTTIFLHDMKDFPAVNQIYADAFGEHKPARSTIEVAALPLGSLIEIECIAVEGSRHDHPSK